MSVNIACKGVRWSHVFAALLLLFVLVEVGSRLLIWQWSGKPYRSLSPYLWSPYGLVRNNPDFTSPDFKINRNGFRDNRDYTFQKPPDTLRILLLGGSALYSGVGGPIVIPGMRRVDSEHTIAQYLARILMADSALTGVDIEVINAAVNFNTIVEVSAGYIDEYVHWRPDVVIVCGSANNFGLDIPLQGAVENRKYGITCPHPWYNEFQRIVNGDKAVCLFERFWRSLEQHLATPAIVRKTLDKFAALSMSVVTSIAWKLGLGLPFVQRLPKVTFAEYDRYIDEYLGYVNAMVADARWSNQDIAFFWEHHVGLLEGIKPLSAFEQKACEATRPTDWEVAKEYMDHARSRVGGFCKENSIPFLDPIDALRDCHETVFCDYLHYTKEGNRFMAHFMYRQLKSLLHRRASIILRSEVLQNSFTRFGSSSRDE